MHVFCDFPSSPRGLDPIRPLVPILPTSTVDPPRLIITSCSGDSLQSVLPHKMISLLRDNLLNPFPEDYLKGRRRIVEAMLDLG